MQKLKQILFGAILGLIFMNPALALAQDTAKINETNSSGIGVTEYSGVQDSLTKFLCTPSEPPSGRDVEQCVNKMYRFGVAFGAIALVFFVVFAGYLYMSGGESGKGKAKGILQNALIGLGLLLGSYLLLGFINPNLLLFKTIQPPIFNAESLPSCEDIGFTDTCVLAGGGGVINVTNTSLSDKVDQLIMFGFKSTTVGAGSDIEYILKNSNIGGVILFGRNMSNKNQITNLNKQLQSLSKNPLFIGVDEEGGSISRLQKAGISSISSATALGKTTPQSVQSLNTTLAKTLHDMGFNVNFAPVLDLTSTASGKFMTTDQRTFSSDPKTAAAYGAAVINGMKSQSIITTGKHFPGLGEVSTNTDKGIGKVTSHDAKALEPYKILSSQLHAVMISHLIDTTVDSKLAASVSPAHINVLRNTIGFGGVIFTDDLDAQGISQLYSSRGQLAVASIKAGTNVLLFSNTSRTVFFEVRDAILKAVEKGEIKTEQIDESYRRVQGLKSSFGLSKISN